MFIYSCHYVCRFVHLYQYAVAVKSLSWIELLRPVYISDLNNRRASSHACNSSTSFSTVFREPFQELFNYCGKLTLKLVICSSLSFCENLFFCAGRGTGSHKMVSRVHSKLRRLDSDCTHACDGYILDLCNVVVLASPASLTTTAPANRCYNCLQSLACIWIHCSCRSN